MTIDGPGAGVLIIDASGNDPTPNTNNGDGSRIFRIVDPGGTVLPEVTISGLTLTGGDANNAGGGAILADNGTLSILQTVLRDNATVQNGGAIAMIAGQLNVTTSELAGNHAGVRGGAIATAPWQRSSTPALQTTRLRRMAVASSLFTSLTIHESTIEDNTAVQVGGGLYASGGTLTVDSSTIDHNQATSGKGGGIGTNNTSLTVDSSTIANNTATTNGGGIDNFGGSLHVYSSTISNNSISGPSASAGAGV